MVDFKGIAKKWQKKWEEKKIFRVKEGKKKKFYNLEMFPYPSSGAGLHMGHVRNYSMGDAYARYKRMQGFNVLYPTGYDSFGLPAENAAIKSKSHPKLFTEQAIKNIIKQQKELGLSYDWDRMIVTCYPEYYKWNQWFFLKFLEKGLAYRKKAPINWCPSCKTVLANEQVVAGRCWRCESAVEIKQLEQWFLKITDYAEELLKDLGKLKGWPEKIKIMQENWIGKSHGTMVDFRLKDTNEILPIFTTRPDTLYGVTLMVFAPEHPKVLELVKGTEYEEKVKKFISKVVIEDRFSRSAIDDEKEGMFIGKYAINPLTNEEIPIYIANFVLLEYGTGFIMAVPTHDQRDFEFAKKYNIPLRVVINPHDYELNVDKMSRAYLGDGVLVNSGQFNGMNNIESIEAITDYLEKKRLGKRVVQYKLRDWLISRQRYWGTPIPVVYCDKCGVVAVPEKDLPVLLPANIKFTGGGNPLTRCDGFVNTKCPKCKGKARRETDTMDTFFDSCWYFLRFCSPKYNKGAFDKKSVKYWMPVDQYIGGAEHAVMHLLYARFFVKVLRDLKLLNFDEPFTKLFNQGIVYKDGHKMSKSFGNIVTPQEISDRYGIDTARLFLLFIASPDKELEWSDKGVEGSFRFLKKVYGLLDKYKSVSSEKDKNLISKTNKLIADVTDEIEQFRFNAAIVDLMEYVNYLYEVRENTSKKVFEDSVKKLCLLMSPFTPHLCEEIWSKLNGKGFVSLADWPKSDKSKIDFKLEMSEELVKRTLDDINAILKLIKSKPKEIQIFVSAKWKYDLFKKLKKELEKTRDFKKIIGKVMVKEYGNEISKIVQSVIKDSSKIPELVVEQGVEFKALSENKDIFEKTFGCKCDVIKAENSIDNKAKNAMPNKPGVLVR